MYQPTANKKATNRISNRTLCSYDLTTITDNMIYINNDEVRHDTSITDNMIYTKLNSPIIRIRYQTTSKDLKKLAFSREMLLSLSRAKISA